MSPMTIDSGVDTVRDLSRLLPESVRDRIEPELLRETPSAAALRVLATIRDERWTEFVYVVRIDWTAMLAWARSPADSLWRGGGPSNSVAVRIELAASLAGAADARPDLLKATYALDGPNFRAFLDALRIAREGLEP
jgi:hypothetical protein